MARFKLMADRPPALSVPLNSEKGKQPRQGAGAHEERTTNFSTHYLQTLRLWIALQ